MNQVQKAFWIFALMIFFTVVADRLLFVIFPLYLIEKQFSATEIGLLFSSVAFVLILVRAFVGRFSDKYGRKNIMSLGLLLTSVSIFFYPLVSRLYQFAVVKTVQELGTTLRMSIRNSIKADSFPMSVRAKYNAKLGTLLPFSRTIAMIAGFLIVTYFSITISFYFASILIFIPFVIFTIFYKEKKPKKKQSKIKIKYSSNFKLFTFSAFVQQLCYTLSYVPAFFILVNINLGISTDLLFLLFIIDYMISVPVIHYLGKRIDSFGRVRSLIFAFMFMGLFILLYPLVSNIIQLLIVMTGVSLSYFIWRIAFNTVIMDSASPKARGEQIGFSESLIGIGDIIGPVTGGILIDMIGIHVPFIITGILLLMISLTLHLNLKRL